MSRVPVRSTQPPPPRGLKLPTISDTALEALANRAKVVPVDEVVYPHAPPVDGTRGQQRYPPLSPPAYLRGVTAIATYRAYFFPGAAVQWLSYVLWLQDQAGDLPTRALRDQDNQGEDSHRQISHRVQGPSVTDGDRRTSAGGTDSVRPRVSPATGTSVRRPTAPGKRGVPPVQLQRAVLPTRRRMRAPTRLSPLPRAAHRQKLPDAERTSPSAAAPVAANRSTPAPPIVAVEPTVSQPNAPTRSSLPPPTTPIDIPSLHDIAVPAVEPCLLRTVLDRLQRGADIGYTGPQTSTWRPNNLSARSRPAAVSRAVQQEVARGHTAGPFPTPPYSPFRCNPLGARDKPDGSVRLILDLSQPEGLSVNSHIDKDSFAVHYTSMDSAIAHIFSAGPQGALLAKADLQHAFRLIPVRPEQRWLLGHHWEGAYYVDLRLPFGLRSACSIFNDLADLLAIATRHHANHGNIHHYLDDFFFIGPAGSGACGEAYQTFLDLCQRCSIPVSPDKCCPPSTRMELLGCVLDTENMSISLPSAKLRALIQLLEETRASRTIRQRRLLSLVGKLIHAVKCIPAGRSFFRRLLDTAHTAQRPHHWVTMSTDTRRDVNWWLSILPTWNGSAPLLHPHWTPPAHLHLHTDASTVGHGGHCGPDWFSQPWPAATLRWASSISWLEMIPILTVCLLWGHRWQGMRVSIHCDNAGVVGAWSKGWSRDRRLMSLIRQTLFVAASRSFDLRVVHVPGTDNSSADALSRLQISRFRLLHPAAAAEPTPVPPGMTAFLEAPAETCATASGYRI